MRTVIVEVKNDILGDGVFWRGLENLIEEIRNLSARMLARLPSSGRETDHD